MTERVIEGNIPIRACTLLESSTTIPHCIDLNPGCRESIPWRPLMAPSTSAPGCRERTTTSVTGDGMVEVGLKRGLGDLIFSLESTEMIMLQNLQK
jgi:hypothetical protein